MVRSWRQCGLPKWCHHLSDPTVSTQMTTVWILLSICVQILYCDRRAMCITEIQFGNSNFLTSIAIAEAKCSKPQVPKHFFRPCTEQVAFTLHVNYWNPSSSYPPILVPAIPSYFPQGFIAKILFCLSLFELHAQSAVRSLLECSALSVLSGRYKLSGSRVLSCS